MGYKDEPKHFSNLNEHKAYIDKIITSSKRYTNDTDELIPNMKHHTELL
jgi:hypothetical protein